MWLIPSDEGKEGRWWVPSVKEFTQKYHWPHKGVMTSSTSACHWVSFSFSFSLSPLYPDQRRWWSWSFEPSFLYQHLFFSSTLSLSLSLSLSHSHSYFHFLFFSVSWMKHGCEMCKRPVVCRWGASLLLCHRLTSWKLQRARGKKSEKREKKRARKEKLHGRLVWV